MSKILFMLKIIVLSSLLLLSLSHAKTFAGVSPACQETLSKDIESDGSIKVVLGAQCLRDAIKDALAKALSEASTRYKIGVCANLDLSDGVDLGLYYVYPLSSSTRQEIRGLSSLAQSGIDSSRLKADLVVSTDLRIRSLGIDRTIPSLFYPQMEFNLAISDWNVVPIPESWTFNLNDQRAFIPNRDLRKKYGSIVNSYYGSCRLNEFFSPTAQAKFYRSKVPQMVETLALAAIADVDLYEVLPEDILKLRTHYLARGQLVGEELHLLLTPRELGTH